MADRLLTDGRDPGSYLVVGEVNSVARMLLDLRTWGEKFAYYYGTMEPGPVRLLRGLYRDGAFLDIGSSRGLYLVCLGRDILSRGGRLLSFEPVPANLERQATNLRLNGLERSVETFDLALGSKEGTLRLYSDPSGADGNAFWSETGTVEVRLRPLDSVLSELGSRSIRVSLIKMDVEGFEPEVIRGGMETIQNHQPLIFAEFCRERMAIYGFAMAESWRALRELGYTCHIERAGQLMGVEEPGGHENLFFVPQGYTLPAHLVDGRT